MTFFSFLKEGKRGKWEKEEGRGEFHIIKPTPLPVSPPPV
jgi:hypothetical protein